MVVYNLIIVAGVGIRYVPRSAFPKPSNRVIMIDCVAKEAPDVDDKDGIFVYGSQSTYHKHSDITYNMLNLRLIRYPVISAEVSGLEFEAMWSGKVISRRFSDHSLDLITQHTKDMALRAGPSSRNLQHFQ